MHTTPLDRPSYETVSHGTADGQQTVIEAILRQAAETPDTIATVCGERAISYGLLMERVERWASELRRWGIGPESIVGIYLAQSADRVTAILAALRAGAAYLPFDRSHPRGRCCDILSASGAAVIITDDNEMDAPVPVIGCCFLDGLADAPEQLPLLDGRQLAYLIYTSGSTGTPKGVAIEHASLLNHMRWMIAQFGAAAAARVVQRTSCAFDASVWEFFLSLMTGGTLVLLDDAENGDPQMLQRLLVREMPTAIQCVPTLLRLALDSGAFDTTSLHYVFVGGETLTLDLAQSARRRTKAAVVNLYGPTETTVDATFFQVGDACGAGESCPIGRPISNVWAKPVSRGFERVTDPSLAELWVGGASVGRGYHREPALTARSFVPSPFSSEPGGRAYRTGDLVRLDDGLLTFVSRADRLIKLHGFRIEPGEIEAVLRQRPEVSDAVVLVKNAGEARTLVAYCLRSTGQTPNPDSARSHLLEQLPRYMVPAQFVWLDQFPLKSNGKLDVAALPEPEIQADQSLPATETERILTVIYSKLFKRPVGVGDNFFDIGGDSIRSIQVISLAKEHGLWLRLQDIFECPTIRALASRVKQSADGARTANAFELVPKQDLPLLDRTRLEDAYPTGMVLDALYFLNETSPRYEIYVTSCELRASWNPEAFGPALARVANRHPWLRTSFAYEGFSRPLQLVHRQVPSEWMFEDLRHLTPQKQGQFLLGWVDREKRRKFNWSEAPVWRISIHRWADDCFQLTLSEPVFDGWSVSSFLGELIVNYAAACAGAEVPLRATPRTSYRDFIVAEQHSLQDPSAFEFWKREVAGDMGRALPRWTRQALEDRGGLRVEMKLSAELSDRLRAIALLASAPLKSVLLSVHARVLSALTGRSCVISGVLMNGRAEETDAEQVLGLHINTAPLVLNLKEATNWLDLIHHVFEVEKAALPHRRYPLAAIQKMHGRTSLFEAAFNFTHFHGLADSLRASGLQVVRYLALDQTFFPLTAQFHVDVNDSTIGLGLDYDSTEFLAAQVEEIASLYRAAVDQLVSAPTRSFKRALKEPAASAAHGVEPSAFSQQSVLDLFWGVVDRQPDRIALTAGEQQLSYAALARAARMLAARLRASGVAGQSVLVCFGSQHKALVALLALLEAGGVYVPIDPEFPAARIAQVARNASALLCLCDENSERQLRDCGLTTLNVNLPELVLPHVADQPPAGMVAPTGPAYRIYTSGSSGVPKGVEVGPDALRHFLLAMRASTGLSPDDIVLGITTIAFDISLLEMLLPITTGARLVALDREVCRDGERLSQALHSSEATLCQATPTTWRMLLEAKAAFSVGLKAISGGEALSPDLAAQLLACDVTLTNAYGPTETTIWSAVASIDSPKAITLGSALGPTTLRVTDAFLDECVRGAMGEIHIGGQGVAHGYVGNPGLTADRFIPDLLGNGQRCYRTGDLGRQIPDCSIEFVGRVDDQIKFRGYRIELGEIEGALRACTGVRSAAVKLVGGDSPVLAAYVVLDRGAAWDEKEAKKQLRQWLPDHMIPRHFVVMDSFPLTANDKLDKSRLPAPAAASPSGKRVVELFEQVKAMSTEDVKRALNGHL